MNLRFYLITVTWTFFVGSVLCENGGVPYAEYQTSCTRRCNEADTKVSIKSNFTTSKRKASSSLGCSCSLKCMQNSNCCNDYIQLCHNRIMPSCSGLCDQGKIDGKPCQCNPECVSQKNCCPDFPKICLTTSVSDAEIEDISEGILFWERDSLSEYLTTNFQIPAGTNCTPLKPTTRFLELNSTAKIPATYFRLKELFNDYVADVKVNETLGLLELQDQYNFLIQVTQSKVMTGVMNFLINKGFITDDATEFVTALRNIWFGYYNRTASSAPAGSSGFEHVFVGEISGNQVSGFHNWLHFLEAEEDGEIIYNGYYDKLKINEKVSIATINFKWQEKCKSTSSMFLGSSPEFELALYTLCWYTRPNSKCPISLGGNKLKIQTYEYVNNVGDKFVSTAYPILDNSSRSNLSASCFSVIFFAASIMLYWKF